MKTETRTWRWAAAEIVDELFLLAPEHEWDLLLDLRIELLKNSDLRVVLDLFVACRERLEANFYLPLYRLRRLLAAHLRLEGECPSLLRKLLLSPRLTEEIENRSLRLVELR